MLLNTMLPFLGLTKTFEGEKGGGSANDDSFTNDDILSVLGEEDDDPVDDDPSEIDDPNPDDPNDNPDDPDPSDDDDDDPDDDEIQDDIPQVNADKKGNLVDKSGKIVAHAGAHRRHYEQLIDSHKKIFQLNQQIRKDGVLKQRAGQALQNMSAELKALKENEGLGKKLGLTPEDEVEFLNLAAKFKSDTPLDAIKYLLTRAQQRGIDIKSLGVPGAATDLSVITNDLKSTLEKSLQPLNERFQQSEQEKQIIQQFEKTREDFYLANQVPEQLVPVMDKLMLENADLRKKGWDFTYLLLQNHLRAQGSKRASPADKRSRPNGRNRPNPSGDGEQPDMTAFEVDTDWKKVVRQTVSDLGGITE